MIHEKELREMGFLGVGNNVLISRRARIFRPERIKLGSNIRIDDFCILSGNITMENYIHMTAGAKIMCGSSKIVIRDFVGFGFQTVIVGEADDFSGEYLCSTTLPERFRKVTSGCIEIGKYSIFGANCVVLPDVKIAEGCAFGAMSLINKNTEPWGMYAGVPCRRYKERKKDMIKLAQELVGRDC